MFRCRTSCPVRVDGPCQGVVLAVTVVGETKESVMMGNAVMGLELWTVR